MTDTTTTTPNQEQQPNELNQLWTLHFDRDGTEDIAIICDADGDELVRSRPFWRPEGNDPTPPAIAAIRVMKAAPKLLESLVALSGLEVKGHSLLSRLQFSEEGRKLAAQIDEAIAEATDDSIGRVA